MRGIRPTPGQRRAGRAARRSRLYSATCRPQRHRGAAPDCSCPAALGTQQRGFGIAGLSESRSPSTARVAPSRALRLLRRQRRREGENVREKSGPRCLQRAVNAYLTISSDGKCTQKCSLRLLIWCAALLRMTPRKNRNYFNTIKQPHFRFFFPNIVEPPVFCFFFFFSLPSFLVI